MSLYHRHDSSNEFTETYSDEKPEDLSHKKEVRKLLEAQLERKRLREEADEFDWDDL